MNPNDFAAAAALFKNPVPSHGPKRNTACHQCRKRKLKCDTKRPCSTCVRSHAYALAHATEGTDIPDGPECTYGDLPRDPPQPQNKVEKLESRISELEGLLRQMQLALEASQSRNGTNGFARCADNGSLSPTFASPSSDVMSPSISQFLDIAPAFGNGNAANNSVGYAASSSTLSPSPPNGFYDGTFPQTNDSVNYFDSMEFTPFGQTPTPDLETLTQIVDPSLGGAMVPHSLSQDRRTQLLLMGWPIHLPEPEVTRHLVHAFFAFNMHAGRLFHGPTFLATLDLSPSDPQFPFPGLLHAMCAVGSLYTADIPQPPIQPRVHYPTNGQFFAVDELFPGRWRQYEQRPDSFAEQQVKFAKLVGDAALDRGEHLLECLQTQIILTWFFLIQARWSESWIAAGHALRCVIPCGINISSPFHGSNPSFLFRPDKPPSILPEAQNVIEHEMRRNMFWIAYAMERQQAAGNSFAMVLDDMDICQLLPLRGDQYEQGVEVPPEERQWSHDRTVLLQHPPNQTDSFILFVKSTILISQVKNFNLRFRGRYFAGDAAMYSPSGSPSDQPDKFDPRDTPAFQELDHLVVNFRSSWPATFRNPVQDEMIDAYLYAASCGSAIALILLHEPHARLTNPQDISATRVLKGARSLLDLMYSISSTSYDVSLLDHMPILSWQVAGRVLVKALKASIETKNYEQMVILQAEITFVHNMLAKAGERMPLAYRYKKMVYDFLASTCGRRFVEQLPETSYHKGGFSTIPQRYDDPAESIERTVFAY